MNLAQPSIGYSLVALILLSVITFGGCDAKATNEPTSPGEAKSSDVPEFSAEVKAVLQKRMQLVSQLAADSTVVEAVRTANEKNAKLTMTEILGQDERWRQTDHLDDFIKPFMTNDCAKFLVDFQEANDGFPEIFVTDQRGLIVAETNRTSDYYQADEDWWTVAFDSGRGMSHYGQIEYDESARSESIALHVPVTDLETGKAIGVVKAVCDITAIKMEL